MHLLIRRESQEVISYGQLTAHTRCRSLFSGTRCTDCKINCFLSFFFVSLTVGEGRRTLRRLFVVVEFLQNRLEASIHRAELREGERLKNP